MIFLSFRIFRKLVYIIKIYFLCSFTAKPALPINQRLVKTASIGILCNFPSSIVKLEEVNMKIHVQLQKDFNHIMHLLWYAQALSISAF